MEPAADEILLNHNHFLNVRLRLSNFPLRYLKSPSSKLDSLGVNIVLVWVSR